MPKRLQISEEEMRELEESRKRTKDKKVDRRLKAILLYASGKKREKIAEQTEFSRTYISELVGKYCRQGIKAIIESKYGGNNRNLTFAEEEALLEPFKKAAEAGHIVEVSREYRYAYGAVEPLTGDSFFLIMPYCNTNCMNVFLKKLSETYPNDYIILCCDGASWHRANGITIPKNIELFFLPPATPEMNPIEQIWKEIRKRGFRNEIFATLEKVIDRLCDTVCSLSIDVIKSITARDWIVECF